MANPPRLSCGGTLVSGNRVAEPAHATLRSVKISPNPVVDIPTSTARRGSLGRTGGHGWGGTHALARPPTRR